MRRPRWLDAKELRRWLTKRCEHCGHRFRWKRDARHSFGNGDRKVYHGPCIALVQWRNKAEERLDMLALVCEVAGLTGEDIRGIVEIRTTGTDNASIEQNAAWRVFYDLEQRQIQATEAKS